MILAWLVSIAILLLVVICVLVIVSLIFFFFGILGLLFFVFFSFLDVDAALLAIFVVVLVWVSINIEDFNLNWLTKSTTLLIFLFFFLLTIILNQSKLFELVVLNQQEIIQAYMSASELNHLILLLLSAKVSIFDSKASIGNFGFVSSSFGQAYSELG